MSTAHLAPRADLRTVAILALVGVAVTAAMVASVLHLWPQARASAMSMQTLTLVRDWQAPRAKQPDVQAWMAARASLSQALILDPASANLHEAMAYLYLQAAQRPGQNPLVRVPYLQQSLAHLQQATAARPMVPSAWANTAMAIHQLATLEPTPAQASRWLPGLWAAFDRALVFGERTQGVQLGLGTVAFSRWGELSPLRRQAVVTMVANATPAQRRMLLAQAAAHRVGLEF